MNIAPGKASPAASRFDHERWDRLMEDAGIDARHLRLPQHTNIAGRLQFILLHSPWDAIGHSRYLPNRRHGRAGRAYTAYIGNKMEAATPIRSDARLPYYGDLRGFRCDAANLAVGASQRRSAKGKGAHRAGLPPADTQLLRNLRCRRAKLIGTSACWSGCGLIKTGGQAAAHRLPG